MALPGTYTNTTSPIRRALTGLGSTGLAQPTAAPQPTNPILRALPTSPTPAPSPAPVAAGGAVPFTGTGSTLTAANVPGLSPPAAPAAQTPFSTFGPGNDLRTTQINPAANPRLQELQGQVDVLRNRLTGEPDLTQAGLERLRLFEEESEQPFQRRLQGVGRQAAALGRIGSGETERQLNYALAEREADISRQRRGIAAELAGQEGAERRANVGSLADLERQLYGQGAGGREELRQERDYQDELARRAMEDALLRGQYETGQAEQSQAAATDLLAGRLAAPTPTGGTTYPIQPSLGSTLSQPRIGSTLQRTGSQLYPRREVL